MNWCKVCDNELIGFFMLVECVMLFVYLFLLIGVLGFVYWKECCDCVFVVVFFGVGIKIGEVCLFMISCINMSGMLLWIELMYLDYLWEIYLVLFVIVLFEVWFIECKC